MIYFRNDWRTFSPGYGWTELTLCHASAEWDRMFKRVEADLCIAGLHFGFMWRYGKADEMDALVDDLAREFQSYGGSD